MDTTTIKPERLRVTFEVDKADFEEARRIMTGLTKDEDPTITLPLTDEQVAFTLYLNGIDSYFESYGDDEAQGDSDSDSTYAASDEWKARHGYA